MSERERESHMELYLVIMIGHFHVIIGMKEPIGFEFGAACLWKWVSSFGEVGGEEAASVLFTFFVPTCEEVA